MITEYWLIAVEHNPEYESPPVFKILIKCQNSRSYMEEQLKHYLPKYKRVTILEVYRHVEE